MAIVVFMDGVLRSEHRVPIFEGLMLYKSLNPNGVVVLACNDEAEAIRWCKEHKVTDVDSYLSDKTVGEYENKDLLKVQRQQSQGPVNLVITADVDLAKQLMENGIKTMLFLHPIYLSARFRPDGREGRKSWDTLVGELDRQVDLLMDDKRV